MSRESILGEVSIERDNQDRLFKKVNDRASLWQLMSLLFEEAGECAMALNEAFNWNTHNFEMIPLRQLRQELVQVAAMSVQLVERIDYKSNLDGEVVLERNRLLERIARGARAWRLNKESDVDLLAALARLDELEGVPSGS